MSNESRTTFTERFFVIERRVMNFVLGKKDEIFFNLNTFDLSKEDCCRLLNAAGIDHHHGQWGIGVFDEPMAVCGQLYPKYTVAVFQGNDPGKRFTLFSVDENDADLFASK